jgi:hypothetical protein
MYTLYIISEIASALISISLGSITDSSIVCPSAKDRSFFCERTQDCPFRGFRNASPGVTDWPRVPAAVIWPLGRARADPPIRLLRF